MATVRMPSSLQAQITRKAISPRLAIRIFLNMGLELGAQLLRRDTCDPHLSHSATQKVAMQWLMLTAGADCEQILPVFDRLAVSNQLFDYFPGDIRFNLIH